MKLKSLHAILAGSLVASSMAYADISGTVFRDIPVNGSNLNTYGVKDSNEPGVSGVSIKGVDASGNSATATTSSDGSYTLSGLSGKVRVEFSVWPTYLKESASSSVNNSSVRFASDGDTIDFGLHNPADYSSDANPDVVMPLQAGVKADVADTKGELITGKYNYNGAAQTVRDASSDSHRDPDTAPEPVSVVDHNSIWATVWQSSKHRLFEVTYLKRHAGFEKTLGTVFVQDFKTGTNTDFDLTGKSTAHGGTIDFGSVDRSGSEGSDNYVAEKAGDPGRDLDAFAKVAKVGMGGADLQEDKDVLWITNLNQRALIKVDVSGNPATGAVDQFPLTEGQNGLPTCDQGTLRPWAVNFNDGKGYLGFVCDAAEVTTYANGLKGRPADNNQLMLHVYSFNPNAATPTFTQEISYTLNDYYKERVQWDGRSYFKQWMNVYKADYIKGDEDLNYAEPIASDIEFDEKGNMYVAIMDRFAEQMGTYNYLPISGDTSTDKRALPQGDLLKVCRTQNSWEMEGTGSCPGASNKRKTHPDGSSTANEIGAISNTDVGEFFDDTPGDSTAHGEAASGAITLLKGSNSLLTTEYDPAQGQDGSKINWYAKGWVGLSTANGDNVRHYASAKTNAKDFGKGNGTGDLELLTAPAPVEVGNRVWLDADADGIQDPGEAGISGVEVDLVCGAKTYKVTTDDNGYYIFSNDPNGTDTTSQKYAIAELEAKNPNSCKVEIPNISTQTPLAGKSVSPTKAGDNTTTDSDGQKSGDNDEATVAPTDVPSNGANNHTYDFGFTEQKKPEMEVTKTLKGDKNPVDNGDGTYTVEYTLTVKNTSDVDGTYDLNETLDPGEGITASTTIKPTITFDGAASDTNGTVTSPFDGVSKTAYKVVEGEALAAGKSESWTVKVVYDVDQNTVAKKDSGKCTDLTDMKGGSGFTNLVDINYPNESDKDNEACASLTPKPEMEVTKTLKGDKNPVDNGDGTYTVEYTLTVKNTSDVDGTYDLNETLDPGEGITASTTIKPTITFDGAASDTNGTVTSPFDGVSKTAYKVVEGEALAAGKSESWTVKVVYDVDQNTVAKKDSGKCTDLTDMKGGSGFTNLVDINYPNESDKDNEACVSLAQKASIGSTVFVDTNNNGKQDAGEAGISKLSVKLYKEDGVTVVSTTTTDGSGNYFFDGLDEGKYVVGVTPDADYPVSSTDIATTNGDNQTDGDDNGIQANSGEEAKSPVIELKIGNEPTNETAQGGDQDKDADSNGDMTVDFGFYNPTPEVDIEKSTNGEDADTADKAVHLHAGDTVTWEYVVTNKGEDVLTNFKVTDDKEAKDGIAASNCKDKDGNAITDLTTFELPVGDSFTCTLTGKAQLGAVYENNSTVTANGKVSGEPTKDHDPSNYKVPTVSIGSLVWNDVNQNGKQDADEKGVAGAEVKLLKADGSDADINGSVVTPQLTKDDGLYYFDGLPEGDYIVKVKPPKGYLVSPAQTKADNDDSENDSNIAKDNGDGSFNSGKFTLEDGTEPNGKNSAIAGSDDADNADDDNGNMTVDFAFFKSNPKIDIEKFTDDNNGVPQQADKESDADVPTLYVGKKVKWTYIVTNTGNVKLTDVNVTDDKEGQITCPKSELAVDENMTCTKESMVKDGKYANEATVVGTPPPPPNGPNEKVKDKDPSHYKGVKPACIGNRIWLDTDANGIQEASEENLTEKVTITLLDENGNKVQDINNSEVAPIEATNGEYEFCNLVPGKYKVKFDIPDGYYFSPKDVDGKPEDGVNNSDTDSDIDPQSGETTVVTLEPGENDPTWDAGVFKPACLGDYTWLDDNVDGIQTDGEKILDGVNVTILDEAGNPVLKGADGSDYTNMQVTKDGKYHFCNLKPGTYKVKFQKDPDSTGAPFISTDKDKGSDSKDSDIPKFEDAKTGLVSDPVTIKSDEDNRTVDAGFIQEICLGDYVWEDTNANGIQEDGEPVLKEVPVKLMMDNGNGWEMAKDVKGNPVDANSTDDKGNYKFCHLKPAIDYKIVFTKPKGYYVTKKDSGDDAKDSDIDENAEITVKKPVKDDMTLDAGLFKPACIGDYIWEDTNANGIQDDGESAVAGVRVELFKKGSTQAVVDADGNTVTLQTTKADGKYLFCQLVPGEYHIKATTPDDYYVTRKEQGADKGKDSDLDPTFNSKVGTTKDTMLESGEKDLTWDGGIFKTACLGDYIWEDKNANGTQDADEKGIAGVELTLVDGNGNEVTNVNGDTVLPYTTTEDGAYKFCQLVPGDYQVKVTKLPDNYYITRDNIGDDGKDSDIASFLETTGDMPKTTLDSGEEDYTFDGGVFKPACLGDYTWKDTNADGIQDEDEEPIAGVKVQIVAQDGSEVTDVFGNKVTELQTDEDGMYHQCNLIPGSYKVKFNAEPDENGAPYISTKQVDDEAKGSDIPEFTEQYGESQAVTLKSGDDYRDIDAGYIQEICLGDYVWFDENLNGIQDKGELGVRDIPVTLTYANGKAVTDVYGNPVKASKTDKKGYYKFCHLTPATDYNIKFKIPESYNATKVNQGSDLKDSDAGKDGVIKVKNPVKDDLTLDMGIYCDCDDYQVNPEGYKELKMPALNVLGLLAMVTAVFVLVRRED